MTSRMLGIGLSVWLLAGCSNRVLQPPVLSPDSPANPAAPEARYVPPPDTLKNAAVVTPAVPESTAAVHVHHHGPSDSQPTAPAHQAAQATPAQPAGEPSAATPAASPAVRYTCPMDPEVVQSTPGRCPKCGMTLRPMQPAAGGHNAHQ